MGANQNGWSWPNGDGQLWAFRAVKRTFAAMQSCSDAAQPPAGAGHAESREVTPLLEGFFLEDVVKGRGQDVRDNLTQVPGQPDAAVEAAFGAFDPAPNRSLECR